uniref:Uncharacterized protein n=1 Tax=Panagrolaimus davidi TaxID=227884 RepID=A0A914PNF4_9BILA
MKNSTEDFTFNSLRIQSFSIPSNIIYYIIKDPSSPNGIQKLQQTCKYFFVKNKVIVVKDGYFSFISWPVFHKTRNINKIHHFNAKFWFTGTLEFNAWQAFFELDITVCSKIYKNDIISLTVNYMHINIKEYEILTSSKNLKTVLIINSDILDDGKNELPIEIILKQLPFITKFSHIKRNEDSDLNRTITNETLKNLIAISNDNKMVSFAISGYQLSPILDPSLFCSFIKRAAAPKASFRFFFNYNSAEQKHELSVAVEQMLKTWDHDQPKPFIHLFDSI